MARQLRIEYAGAVYHVTSRGNERKKIFLDEEDRERFLLYLGELPGRFGVVIHGYVLMDNHYHVLLETRLPNLHKAMQYLNTAYSVYFNRRHARAGHFLQGRYKSYLIQKDSYLHTVSRYLHLNPVRAHMVNRPQEYAWSSYRDYIGKRKRRTWLTREWVLGQFSEKPEQARNLYRKFVEDGLRRDDNPFASLKSGLILGSEGFMDEIRQKFSLGRHPDISQSRRFEETISFEAVLGLVSAHFGVDEHEIKRAGKRDNIARRVCLHLLRTLTGMSNGEIAKRFQVTHSAVAKASARLKREMEHSEELRSFVNTCLGSMSNVKV